MVIESSQPDAALEQCPKCSSRHIETGYGLFGVYARCQTCRTRFEIDAAVQAWWFEGVPAEERPAARMQPTAPMATPAEATETLALR
jgi:hypothetical protein